MLFRLWVPRGQRTLSRFSRVRLFCNPMDCSPSSSSVHGISQVRILEWVAISSSKWSSWPRYQTWVFSISCIRRQVLLPLAPPAKPVSRGQLVQFSSVAQSYPTLCDPMDCSTPGLPVHHQLPEFTQTHIHRVSDAIQPSHPLLSPSPPAFNLSQHQGLFQWVSSLNQVAKVLRVSASTSALPMNIQDWFPLGWTG